MNVLTPLASPRADANAGAILGWVEGTLREEAHSISRLDLTKLQIGGCRFCFACAESADEPGCVLINDAQDVLRGMTEADRPVRCPWRRNREQCRRSPVRISAPSRLRETRQPRRLDLPEPHRAEAPAEHPRNEARELACAPMG